MKYVFLYMLKAILIIIYKVVNCNIKNEKNYSGIINSLKKVKISYIISKKSYKKYKTNIIIHKLIIKCGKH